MSNLISGKEALIALANGESIQYKHDDDPSIQDRWTEITKNYLGDYHLDYFLDGKTKWKFRLKPRTITLNGIEVPAPFEPKEGDEVWFISDDHPCGYAVIDLHKQKFQFGAWRSEEEIKQVVEALRSIFK